MNKTRPFMLLASVLAVLSAGIPTYGQRVWDKKPYHQWSFYEVMEVLNDSPLGKLAKDNYSPYLVIIRLQSALPIRQALVRQEQIRLNYDKLTVADKAKFDLEVKEFLECTPCARYYIVTYRIISEDLKVRRLLKDFSLKELQPYVFLTNDEGERRNLVHFMPPGSRNGKALLFESAVFFFERLDEKGKPLLTTDSKKFYFQIDQKAHKLKSIPIKKLTFEVSKLTHNGEIIF